MIRMLPVKDIIRLLAKVQIKGTDECWGWKGNTYWGGYGQIKMGGKPVGAHRYTYQLCFGPIPEGLQVRHTCNNPPCCNPQHLILGTLQDNMQDKVRANRQAKGERNGGAKLSQEQVNDIRYLIETTKLPYEEIAAAYNVHRSTIWRIRTGRHWREEKKQ